MSAAWGENSRSMNRSMQAWGQSSNPNDKSSYCLKSMPNLPGYSSNKHQARAMKQSFKCVRGVLMECTNDTKMNMRSLGSKAFEYPAQQTTPRKEDRLLNPPPKADPKAKWNLYAQVVLKFDAYFKEAVVESEVESWRSRNVVIYYYMEDDTMQVVETKKANSGIPQGNFVHRHCIPNPHTGGNWTVDDLDVGAELEIYNRTFVVTGCNASTRQFLEDTRGCAVGGDCAQPPDAYTSMRDSITKMDLGQGEGCSNHNIKKNPMKKFAEATLGSTVNNKGRGPFLQNDRKVLRFYCAAQGHGGDVTKYTIHYFLADDTIEVKENPTANSGRDPYPYLIRRQKLRRGELQRVDDPNGRVEEEPASTYYHWSDFVVGQPIVVYGQQLQVLEADGSTRRFFEQQGAPLAKGLQVAQLPQQAYDHQVAKWDGFGTEVDSLSSCGRLVPKARKTKFDQVGKTLDQTILRFSARMDTERYDEKARRFVISYFVADNTISVREPPIRNSGIVGGNFLKRQELRNAATGQLFQPEDLFSGAKVTVSRRRFVVLDVDEHTSLYMEGKPAEFPLCSYPQCCALIGGHLGGRSAREVFCELDKDMSGVVDKDTLDLTLSRLCPEVPRQSILTVMRQAETDVTGAIKLQELSERLGGEGKW